MGDDVNQGPIAAYFVDESEFNSNYLTDELLVKLPQNLTSSYLLEYKRSLETSLNVVSKKVSELILHHQPTYIDELQRIANLQKSITESIKACTQGRSSLKEIKETTKNGVTIVEHHRKRESLSRLLNSLTTISDLRSSVLEIRSLLDIQEDFPKAIQMCKDGKSLLASFQEYKCVNDFGSKLSDTIDLIGEQVDTVLAKMCMNFDFKTYEKLQTSYNMMDRSEIAVDQLLMHFCNCINSQALDIVMKHLTGSNSSSNDHHISEVFRDTYAKTPDQKTSIKSTNNFQELCKLLDNSQFYPCLLELCNSYWVIMLNYQRILQWHGVDKNDDSQPDLIEGPESLSEESNSTFKRHYVEKKLLDGSNRIWHDVKRKLTIIITSHDFSGYRFDEFIQVLATVDLMIQISHEFCRKPSSKDIYDSLNAQALNFFKSYHSSSLEELKVFLENELWEMVPVKDDFRLANLKEFSFLRPQADTPANMIATGKLNFTFGTEDTFFSPTIIEVTTVPNNSKNHIIDTKAADNAISSPPISPFDKLLRKTADTTEDLFGIDVLTEPSHPSKDLPLDKISLSSGSDFGCSGEDDEEMNVELHKDFVEEDDFVSSDEELFGHKNENDSKNFNQPKLSSLPVPQAEGNGLYQVKGRLSLVRTSSPVLTNSSLNVLRLFGRYIQIMSVLEPISYEILMRIYNLMDNYTMIVYKKFGPDSIDRNKSADDKNLSPMIKSAIMSIRQSLIGNQFITTNATQSTGKSVSNPLPPSPSYNLIKGAPNVCNIIMQDLTSSLKATDNKCIPNPHSGPNCNTIDPKKAVAIESLIYLVNQLWNLQEYLESLIPVETRPLLKEQFSQQGPSIVPEFLKARAEL